MSRKGNNQFVKWKSEKVATRSGVDCYSKCVINNLVLSVGDFVYVSNPEKPHAELQIVEIKNFYEIVDPLTVDYKYNAVVESYRRPQTLPGELTDVIEDLDPRYEVIQAPVEEDYAFILPLNSVRGKCEIVMSTPSQSVAKTMDALTMENKGDVFICRYKRVKRNGKQLLVAVNDQHRNSESKSLSEANVETNQSEEGQTERGLVMQLKQKNDEINFLKQERMKFLADIQDLKTKLSAKDSAKDAGNSQMLNVPEEFQTTSPSKKTITIIGPPPQPVAPPDSYFGWIQRIKVHLGVWTPSNEGDKIVFEPHRLRRYNRGGTVFSCSTRCPGSWFTDEEVMDHKWVTITDQKSQPHTCDLTFDYSVFFDSLDGTLTNMDDGRAEFNAPVMNLMDGTVTFDEGATNQREPTLHEDDQLLIDFAPLPLMDGTVTFDEGATDQRKPTLHEDQALIDLTPLSLMDGTVTFGEGATDHREPTLRGDQPLVDLTPLPLDVGHNPLLFNETDQRLRDVFGDSLIDNWGTQENFVPTVVVESRQKKTKIPTKVGFLSSAKRF